MRAQEFQPKKLVIFDIDDTLVHTQTKVNVVKDGQVTKELNSHDFTHYKLQPGEQFDFENFRNAHDFFHNSKPIIPMMDQLKNDIATGNKVVMVTARADFDDRELFLDTFRKYGVDIDRVHVYRAGNMTGKMQTEEKKKIIIRNLLDKGNYTKAIMYDDAVPNLDSFVELKDEYASTKFYAWHVSLEGEASEYHRTNETLEERKKKRRVRNAAYGPGLYGGYGYFSTYGNSDSTGGDGGGDGGGESIHENITPNTIHKLADRKGVKWDNEPSFLRLTKRLTGKEHLDDLDQVGLQKVQRHLEKQGVAKGSQEINWVKPNFDFEWHEVEEQSRMKQVPVDVRQYYQKHFPNKDAWLKAVQNGKAVVVPPDHAYEIRNAPFDKASLQKVLAPTGHEGPIGPAKEKRVNDLFDKGQVEMPIILKTSQGLWLIGGKTRLGTANYVKGLPAKVWLISGEQGVAEGKITLSTDPNWYGATVDNYQATGPVVNISADRLVGFEPDSKMNQPKSQANVKKIVAGLKKGDKLPPLLVRKYKDGYQVLDGHHRFWAYKLLGTKSIPVQIVPAKDIEEISKQGVAENFADGKNPQDKGDSKRHGVPTKASVSTLRKVAKQGGRKGQLAHWMANMKAGKQK